MSADKKPEDQITEAGAIELAESQLDDASGGADMALDEPTVEAKPGRTSFSNIVLKRG